MAGEQGGTAGWEAKVRPLRKQVKAAVSIFHQRGDMCSTGEQDGWPARFASSLARDFAGYF